MFKYVSLKLVGSVCYFHSFLSTCKNSKSCFNAFKGCWWLKNTQIWLGESSSGVPRYVCSKRIDSVCSFHSCLPTFKNWKSDVSSFKRYWWLKNTQIWLDESIFRHAGACLLQINRLCLFLSSISSYMQSKMSIHSKDIGD